MSNNVHIDNNSDNLKISQASKILGVSTKTLRRWEKKGLIKSSRSLSGHRIYSLSDLHRPTVEDVDVVRRPKDNLLALAFTVLMLAVAITFSQTTSHKSPITESEGLTLTRAKSAVLATTTSATTPLISDFVFTVNVPAVFNEGVTFDKDITAPNVVYSFNGETGDITYEATLTAGSGITIDGLKITNSGITSLSAGTGVSVSGSTITNSDLGSSQLVFKTISVAGQSDVVSDINADILTLVASGGITITNNATTDTITISSASPDYTLSGWQIMEQQ